MTEEIDRERGYPDVAAIQCYPGLTAEQLEAYTEGRKAVLLMVYATGSLNSIWIPVIEMLTRAGVPVFVVATSGIGHVGINRADTYPAQREALAAGLISLRNVPQFDFTNVLAIVQDEIDSGKTGQTLADAVQTRLGEKQQTPKTSLRLRLEEWIASHIRRKPNEVFSGRIY